MVGVLPLGLTKGRVLDLWTLGLMIIDGRFSDILVNRRALSRDARLVRGEEASAA